MCKNPKTRRTFFPELLSVSTEPLRLGSKSTTLVISEPQAAIADLFPQNAIFLD
jgi:hypothetical protein